MDGVDVNAPYETGYYCWESLLTDLMGLFGEMFAETRLIVTAGSRRVHGLKDLLT